MFQRGLSSFEVQVRHRALLVASPPKERSPTGSSGRASTVSSQSFPRHQCCRRLPLDPDREHAAKLPSRRRSARSFFGIRRWRQLFVSSASALAMQTKSLTLRRMKRKCPLASGLGKKGRGVPKTMTDAAVLQRIHAGRASAKIRSERAKKNYVSPMKNEGQK